MKKETAELIVENSYGEYLELRENYSGRGMYGETTTGIVGEMGDFLDAVANAYMNLLEEMNEDYSEQENNTYVVREPEQIHILGSKEDVERFKNFVKK